MALASHQGAHWGFLEVSEFFARGTCPSGAAVTQKSKLAVFFELPMNLRDQRSEPFTAPIQVRRGGRRGEIPGDRFSCAGTNHTGDVGSRELSVSFTFLKDGIAHWSMTAGQCGAEWAAGRPFAECRSILHLRRCEALDHKCSGGDAEKDAGA
jgi:hypothetical protein